MTDDALSDDDLAVAVREPVELVTAADFTADLERWMPLAQALVRGFAANRIRMSDVEQRHDLVVLRARAAAIRELLGLVTGTVDRVFAAYAAETEATTIPLGEGRKPVLYDKPRADWVTQAEPLRRELLRLSALDGAPTADEIEKAIKPVIEFVPDHRTLNSLATRYGGDVRAAIEKYRVRPEIDPAKGRAKFPEVTP